MDKGQIEAIRDYLLDLECPFNESDVNALCDAAVAHARSAEWRDAFETVQCYLADERDMALRACNLPRASALSDVADVMRRRIPVQVAEPATQEAKAKPNAEAEQEAQIFRPGPELRLALMVLLNHVEPGWDNCKAIVQAFLRDGPSDPATLAKSRSGGAEASLEPVTYCLIAPGCVTGPCESVESVALAKARGMPSGTAVVPLYRCPPTYPTTGEK